MSSPTRINAESTSKGGLVTTLPPTYMRECKRAPKFGEDRSKTMASPEHPRRSSARSRRAMILVVPVFSP